jgi:chromate transport protein ChrA
MPHQNQEKTDNPDILSVVFSAAFILTRFFKIHPILMIILAGISGLFLY